VTDEFATTPLSGADSLAQRRAAREPQLTACGLSLPAGMQYRDWAEVGLRLWRLANSSAWAVGDWASYGQEAYGERYRRAIEVTGFDYQTLRNYAWVARCFDLSRRRDKLSFAHHAEVAARPAAEQDLWLARAERERWSRNELRSQLARDRRVKRPALPGTTVTLKVSSERQERWQRAADAEGRDVMEWIRATIDSAADSALATEQQRKAASQ
jgi:hypothetical protein